MSGSPGTGSLLADVVAAQERGEARGVASICSAHPAVLRAAFEQALEDGASVLVESTCNQVNQEGGYTGVRPAEFVAFARDLARQAGLDPGRVVLGGDHLGPNPWTGLAASAALERAAEMVRQYVRAGYEKIHLDASMRCGDDPPGALADEVVATRTAALAAVAEAAAAERPPGSADLVYVIGTEVPPPGGQAPGHGGPLPTRAPDAERSLRLTREAFEARGLRDAWPKVVAQVVQPGVEFGDDVVYGYRQGAASDLRRFAQSEGRLVFEAHSTDYQTGRALRALVEDRFAILKVGPELTFAYREAVFALEAVERELLERRAPQRLSGARAALDAAMRADPRHWKAWYGDGDEETLRLSRAWSLSDRARYYWPVPQVQQAVERLFANLDVVPLPRGLVSQHLPWAGEAAHGAPRPGLAAELARRGVRRVLARYAGAVSGGARVAEAERLSL